MGAALMGALMVAIMGALMGVLMGALILMGGCMGVPYGLWVGPPLEVLHLRATIFSSPGTLHAFVRQKDQAAAL